MKGHTNIAAYKGCGLPKIDTNMGFLVPTFSYNINNLVVTALAQASNFPLSQVCPDIFVAFLLATFLLSTTISSSLSSDPRTWKLFPRSLATLSPFDNQ